LFGIHDRVDSCDVHIQNYLKTERTDSGEERKVRRQQRGGGRREEGERMTMARKPRLRMMIEMVAVMIEKEEIKATKIATKSERAQVTSNPVSRER
jgi:hypothetical protein